MRRYAGMSPAIVCPPVHSICVLLAAGNLTTAERVHAWIHTSIRYQIQKSNIGTKSASPCAGGIGHQVFKFGVPAGESC
jgi:hypothetical protein